MLKNKNQFWVLSYIFGGAVFLSHQCLATQDKKPTNYDKDVQEIVKSSKACTDENSVRNGKCSKRLGKAISIVDPKKLKEHAKDIQEIVTISSPCKDAKSIASGKCVKGVGEDIFGLKEMDLKQTKVQPSEIIVFVSLSMPTASLKSIHHDLKKVGGRMVVRGLVDGSFRKTQERMNQLGISVDVDPPLFEQYDIKQVPVTMNRINETEFDSMKGNIRLEGALEAFSNRGDFPLQATHHLKKLRGESK